jgi:phage gp45-like
MMYDLFRTELRETQDDGDQQTVTLYGVGGEELTKVHRVQHFGLSSAAPVGSHGIGMSLHGRRDLVVALGLENAQHRPRATAPGGTVLYDAFGSAVSLVQANLRIVHSQKVEMVCNGATIVMEGGKVKINA